MKVITSLEAKRREKQIKYERKVLKELSVQHIQKSIYQYFDQIQISSDGWFKKSAEEGCLDVAIEAYLLGATFSRFSLDGEPVDKTKRRCQQERDYLADTLYYFWLSIGYGEEHFVDQSIEWICKQFVDTWWMEGYEMMLRKYKLRLH